MTPACVPTKALLAFFSSTLLNRYAYAQFVTREDAVYVVLRGLRDREGGIDDNRIFVLRWHADEDWQPYHGPWHAWLKAVTRPEDSAAPPPTPTA